MNQPPTLPNCAGDSEFGGPRVDKATVLPFSALM